MQIQGYERFLFKDSTIFFLPRLVNTEAQNNVVQGVGLAGVTTGQAFQGVDTERVGENKSWVFSSLKVFSSEVDEWMVF